MIAAPKSHAEVTQTGHFLTSDLVVVPHAHPTEYSVVLGCCLYDLKWVSTMGLNKFIQFSISYNWEKIMVEMDDGRLLRSWLELNMQCQGVLGHSQGCQRHTRLWQIII